MNFSVKYLPWMTELYYNRANIVTAISLAVNTICGGTILYITKKKWEKKVKIIFIIMKKISNDYFECFCILFPYRERDL